jgi:hypothetical protein
VSSAHTPPLAALRPAGLSPRRQRKEHHDVERYVVFT